MQNRTMNRFGEIATRLAYYKWMLSEDMALRAEHEWQWFCTLRGKCEDHLGNLNGKCVLEVGCGQRPWLTLLFCGIGCHVTGIDSANMLFHAALIPWMRRVYAEEGVNRLLRTLFRKLLGKDRRYYRELERVAGFPLPRNEVNVRQMDVCNMDLEDATFDVVVSLAVLEHVLDAPSALSEIARVTKPGGLSCHVIHLWTSLSGGHHPQWADPAKAIPISVPPWDHLRKSTYPVSYASLNKLRKHEWLAMFKERFELLEVSGTTEGELLLTPEIARELCNYSREELLQRDLIIVAKRCAG